MSEATLQTFLERLNTDASFRESVQANPEGAFAEFGLSPAEQAAFSLGDEDALRRLAGTDVSGHIWYTTLITKYVSSNCSTPGSGQHCGTGSCTPGSGTGCGTGANG
jgi:hypothetical protein